MMRTLTKQQKQKQSQQTMTVVSDCLFQLWLMTLVSMRVQHFRYHHLRSCCCSRWAWSTAPCLFPDGNSTPHPVAHGFCARSIHSAEALGVVAPSRLAATMVHLKNLEVRCCCCYYLLLPPSWLRCLCRPSSLKRSSSSSSPLSCARLGFNADQESCLSVCFFLGLDGIDCPSLAGGLTDVQTLQPFSFVVQQR